MPPGLDQELPAPGFRLLQTALASRRDCRFWQITNLKRQYPGGNRYCACVIGEKSEKIHRFISYMR